MHDKSVYSMHVKLLKIALFSRLHLFIYLWGMYVSTFMCLQVCGDQRLVLGFFLNGSPLDILKKMVYLTV